MIAQLSNRIAQPSQESHFLADFLAFLDYIRTHQVRITTLKHHIPLRHLKDLACLMRGREPFHPLQADGSFEMRCQRDQRRIDFMDMLATHMDLIGRSEMGYILPLTDRNLFVGRDPDGQAREIWRAYWTMDWNSLYPWMEVVDQLVLHRPELLRALAESPAAKKIPLNGLSPKLLGSDSMQQGFFWVVIRPLEYLGLAESYFAKDAEGFWSPVAFAIKQDLTTFLLDTPKAKPDTPTRSW